MICFRRVFLLCFLCFVFLLHAQVKLCCWNLENFGSSKPDSTIRFIANTLKDFDLVAVVEVVAGKGGAQAVARLADQLDRTSSDWDYCISDPTSGKPNASERYAFLWKTSRIKKKGNAWLEQKFKAEIEREPYLGDFGFEGKEFTVVAFHALPKEKQPETEIKYFKFLPEEYPGKALVFCGDFNCPQSNTVFGPLKNMYYQAALMGQKTSLKMKCSEDGCLASEYDNLFYDAKKLDCIHSGALYFYTSFSDMKQARRVSDHLPVYMEFLIH